jgi:hypothetical protein
MPFGLSDALRVFSLIMRKIERQIRELWGVKVVIYLDDIIVLHQDPKRLEEIGKELADYLKYLGWTVNIEKSHLVPSKTFTYLVWTLDSTNMTIQLTKERYKTGLFTTRQLDSVIGTLSATRLQFPLASLYLEKLHWLKNRSVQRDGWNGMVYLEPSIVGELSHWT